MKRRTKKINVLGSQWALKFLKEKSYTKNQGDGHLAITHFESRIIYFNLSSLTKETIIHELVHAYTAQLSLTELDLDEDQTEEFFCEMFAKHGKTILDQSEEIYADVYV